MWTNPQQLHEQLLHELTPAMRYHGSDFSAWQQKAREQLGKLLCMPEKNADDDLVIEWTQEHETCTEIRFTFVSEAGYRAPAHLLLPRGVERPIPMICLQGHSTGMHISLGRPRSEEDQEDIDGGRDFAIQAIQRGYAAVTLELRAFGESGGTEKGPACAHPAYTALLLGRTLQGERVFDTMRLIDVLQAHFADKLNTDKIGLVGNSGGSTCSFYTMAMDERVTLGAISCAFTSYYSSIGVGCHCPCNYVPGLARDFDMGDIAGLIVPRPLIIINGRHDPSFPWDEAVTQLDLVRPLYAQGGNADKVVHLIGEEGHRFYPDIAWPEINRLMK